MSSPAAQQRRFTAGNWKMNLNYDEGVALARELAARLGDNAVPTALCAPAIHLAALRDALSDAPRVSAGAQDLSQHLGGAHTGEVSADQLASVGVSYVLVGHSERRSAHGESGGVLAAKLQRALGAGLRPIFCFGETLGERDAGREREIVEQQLREGLDGLDAEQMGRVVLAYEPVWAIGTGRTASPRQAQDVHAVVRAWLAARFGESLAAATTILYGGSVKPNNAAELFAQPDIDGGLIGGASLRADDFVAIVEAYGDAS